MESPINRLCLAIGYPEDEVRVDGTSRVLVVDGSDVRVEISGNRMIFRYALISGLPGDGKDMMIHLAEYAAGRLLKEEAVLAWDESSQELFLWQAASAESESNVLRQMFELFLVSCDWWKSRVSEESARVASPALCEMFIRP